MRSGELATADARSRAAVVAEPSASPPDHAVTLASAFMSSGYMFPLIKGTEALAAVMLLSNRFVPLALALLAPVVVNIVAFHAFLAPTGVGMTVVILALEMYLAWGYRAAYRPMLATRASPSA